MWFANIKLLYCCVIKPKRKGYLWYMKWTWKNYSHEKGALDSLDLFWTHHCQIAIFLKILPTGSLHFKGGVSGERGKNKSVERAWKRKVLDWSSRRRKGGREKVRNKTRKGEMREGLTPRFHIHHCLYAVFIFLILLCCTEWWRRMLIKDHQPPMHCHFPSLLNR